MKEGWPKAGVVDAQTLYMYILIWTFTFEYYN